MSQEAGSTLLLQFDGVRPAAKDLKEEIEKGDIPTKTAALKKLIMLQLSGESQQAFIMPVIKYCVPVEDHKLKKLLIYFWESVDKTDQNGKLLPEMILFCSFVRSDLQHPNEYVRGVTLRFLCKIREKDILEPLVSAVTGNLTHRVTFVRRNAVLAVQNIFQRFPELLSNAPELIEKFLDEENDVSAKRNAFNMLFQCAQDRAVRYLDSFRETHDMSEVGDMFQLAIVDLVKILIQQNPFEKGRYIPIVFSTLHSKSPAVLYQCASTLLTLSSSPTAIKQAATTFMQVLSTHSDNNVRLIVLDRLDEMKKHHSSALEESLMELLRCLTTGNMDIRRRVITLSIELVTPKNVEGYVNFMKKELVRSQSEDIGDEDAQQEYRRELVKAIHTTVMRHTSVAATVVPIMLDYICEPGTSAYDVVLFIREVMAAQPELRSDLLTKMTALFPMIASPKVLRTVLWLFGVHSSSVEEIANVFEQLKTSLHPLPLAPLEEVKKTVNDDEPTTIATTTVREDGTYQMSIALVDKKHDTERSDLQGIRSQICSGDFFLATALANTLAKLTVQVFKSHAPSALKNSIQTDSVEMMEELIRYGTSRQAGSTMDDDCHERIKLGLMVVKNPTNTFITAMVEDSVLAFDAARGSTAEEKEADEAAELTWGAIDQPITFSQFLNDAGTMIDFSAADDVAAAVTNETVDKDGDFLSKLNRVVTLSGSSDPIYAEATITVHPFDILVEMFLVNQTKDTMQNVSVELAVQGDLKLCEQPQTYTIPPGGNQTVKSSIKVCSTEAGSIYGNIVYDTPASDRNCVILNDIRLNIMDYIKPAVVSSNEFRSMWLAFEWENKVIISTDITDPKVYAKNLMKITNTASLEDLEEEEECDYYSLKLYARSVFGEDALANVSIEKNEDGKLEGVVRIRTKTQGMALGLGHIVAENQKTLVSDKKK